MTGFFPREAVGAGDAEAPPRARRTEATRVGTGAGVAAEVASAAVDEDPTVDSVGAVDVVVGAVFVVDASVLGGV
jgi:hypothetical protein